MAARSALGGVVSIFIRSVGVLSRLGSLLAILLLVAAVIVVCQMVVMRYLLNASTVWQTEFVVYALVAATFLGSAHVLVEKGHVGVDLLPVALGGRWQTGLEILGGLLSIAFLAILGWSGWNYFHEAWAGNWTTDTVWALPLWIPLLPLPLGVGLLVLQYVAEILKIVQGGHLQTGPQVHGLGHPEGMAD